MTLCIGRCTWRLPSNLAQQPSNQHPRGLFTAASVNHQPHIIHFLQDYSLGTAVHAYHNFASLYNSPQFPLAIALRRLVENWWQGPNARLVTRCFLVPSMILGILTLIVPGLFGELLARTLFHHEIKDDASKALFMRLVYPLLLGLGSGLFLLWQLVKAAVRWRTRVRDEVYLVGERLHNFGECATASGLPQRQSPSSRFRSVSSRTRTRARVQSSGRSSHSQYHD